MEEGKPKLTSRTPIEHLQREKKLRKRAQKELQTTQKKLDQHKQIISEQKQKIEAYAAKLSRLQQERRQATQELNQVKDLERQLAEKNGCIQLEKEKRNSGKKAGRS